MILSVRGARPAAQAWEDYARIERWASWSPQIRRVDASAPRIAPGVTGTVHGPLGVRVRFEVSAVDHRSRTWRWEVRCGGVSAGLEHRVLALPGGCLTTLDLDAPALLAAAYAPAAVLALRRLTRA